jgi:ABC-2 type transport system ATP-binding protein
VKRYGTLAAVDGIDLEVGTGECFGLLGPNGAGKTTTMEILEGLLPASAGEVEVLGRTWTKNERALRARLGIALQETRLSEKLSVQETLAMFRSFYPSGREVGDVLAEVQLTEKREAWVGKLSGGQRQRLAVACALVGDPELVFLDEPTTGLDPQSRRQLWDLVDAFKKRGRTVLLTTHYMDEAERLCDRLAIIDKGKVIALGTPRELIARLGGTHQIEFALLGGATIEPSVLSGLAGVTAVRQAGGAFNLTVTEPHVSLPALISLLEDRGLALERLTTHHSTLEDVFVSLTGRNLRDA